MTACKRVPLNVKQEIQEFMENKKFLKDEMKMMVCCLKLNGLVLLLKYSCTLFSYFFRIGAPRLAPCASRLRPYMTLRLGAPFAFDNYDLYSIYEALAVVIASS